MPSASADSAGAPDGCPGRPMLRTRIITALILAPSIIAAIYLLPTQGLAWLLWALAATAAWEWAGLSGLSAPRQRAVYVLALTVVFIALSLLPSVQLPLLYALAVIWCLALVAVMIYPAAAGWIRFRWLVGLLGAFILPGAVVALVTVHRLPDGANWMLFVLVICWAADIGAYFAGKALGRHKLAPAVSPGKTWEGAAGGLTLAMVVCPGILLAADRLSLDWALVLVGLVGISIVGDLFESLLKRATGIKDSSQLLPGHGGVLDRVDSILSVTPFFTLWMLQLTA